MSRSITCEFIFDINFIKQSENLYHNCNSNLKLNE